MSHPDTAAFNPDDPHGFHAHDQGHGHVIVPQRVLLGVLTVLLVFTILTVFASRAEMWIGHTFDVDIPQWINVVVAMSIAVVKASLVALFFMQLRYDTPLNSIIFLFCLFALGLFLMFAMLDLSSRGTIYRWKSGEVLKGGTQDQVAEWVTRWQVGTPPAGNEETGFTPEASRQRVPIIVWAREHYIDELAAELGNRELAIEEYQRRAAIAHGHDPDHHEHEVSDASKSRPGHGVTPHEFDVMEGMENHAEPAAGGH